MQLTRTSATSPLQSRPSRSQVGWFSTSPRLPRGPCCSRNTTACIQADGQQDKLWGSPEHRQAGQLEVGPARAPVRGAHSARQLSAHSPCAKSRY